MPRMVMVFPLIIILVFPFAANMEVRNIRLAVVDNDCSDQSATIRKVRFVGYFKLLSIAKSPAEAQKIMDRGDADAI